MINSTIPGNSLPKRIRAGMFEKAWPSKYSTIPSSFPTLLPPFLLASRSHMVSIIEISEYLEQTANNHVAQHSLTDLPSSVEERGFAKVLGRFLRGRTTFLHLYRSLQAALYTVYRILFPLVVVIPRLGKLITQLTGHVSRALPRLQVAPQARNLIDTQSIMPCT